MSEFSELVGKTLISVTVGDDVIRFTCSDRSVYRQFHEQSCCEDVRVEDITGDIADVLHSQILVAEEVTNSECDPPGVKVATDYRESFTWTFYKLGTVKGGITIRWYGTSNGYYSERVELMLEATGDEQ
jgi:hypothetical protein